MYGSVVREDAIVIGKGQNSIRQITTKIVNYNLLKKIMQCISCTLATLFLVASTKKVGTTSIKDSWNFFGLGIQNLWCTMHFLALSLKNL
jgi:hypothetical protein